jgi:glutaredoxin-like protein
VEILSPDIVEATRKALSEGMINQVTLLHFSQEPSRLVLPDYLKGQECLFCKETKQMLQEVSDLSEKLTLIVYDFTADKDQAELFGIDKIPATLLLGEKDTGIRFFGIPSGYEYASFLESIIDVSKGKSRLDPLTIQQLQAVKKALHIQVFVTPTCPYCTSAVRLAHQFALESAHIRADMVESTEFPHLTQKYNISGVPKTIINESISIDGAVPEDAFLEQVLKAAHFPVASD